jgi:hypothetical protein
VDDIESVPRLLKLGLNKIERLAETLGLLRLLSKLFQGLIELGSRVMHRYGHESIQGGDGIRQDWDQIVVASIDVETIDAVERGEPVTRIQEEALPVFVRRQGAA